MVRLSRATVIVLGVSLLTFIMMTMIQRMSTRKRMQMAEWSADDSAGSTTATKGGFNPWPGGMESLLRGNNENAKITAQEEDDNSKYLVIHVGPQKTASTYLQGNSRFYANTTLLPKDHYIYVGKGAAHLSRLYDAMKDFSCRYQIQQEADAATNSSDNGHTSVVSSPLPACFDTFIDSMEKFGDLNVLISSEDFQIPNTIDTPAWWTAVKDTAAQFGYKVVVVITYRRLYEWLPSAYTQNNRGGLGNGRWNDWPSENPSAKRVEHPYPLFVQSEYVNRVNGTIVWFRWTASYLEAMPENIETRVLNIYSPHSTRTKFFCDMVPAAHATCEACLELERAPEQEDDVSNPSTPLAYDMLTVAADDAGLIDTQRFRRRDIARAAEEYNARELNRTAYDFIISCPPQEAYEELLEASLYWENKLVPEMKDQEEEHRAGFWAAVEKKKYCWVDEEATLQQDEWKAFFQRYASAESTKEDLDPLPDSIEISLGDENENTKIAASPEGNDNSKYLVIHVGPQKTASTFLQGKSRFYANTTLLPKDNYVYVGKGAAQLSQLYDAMKDFSCRYQIQQEADAVAAATNSSDNNHTSVVSSPLPACFDTFIESMEKFGDLNVLISSEDFNIPITIDTPAWWTAVKDTAAQFGYKVVVVITYRRLYEWLPSAYTQTNRGGVGNGLWNDWPSENPRAKRVEHPYPKFLQSEYVNRVNGTGVWFRWTSSYLDAMPEYIETRVLNLYSPHSTQTKFFCDMVPAAYATCAECLELERAPDGDEGVSNPSTPLGYDMVTVAADDAGLIDTQRFRRKDIARAAEEYNARELNRTAYDFPMNCPPQEAYEKLLEASLYWENKLVPELKDQEEEHRAGFWAAVEKKKYCWVDEEATLQQDEWKAFFQRYSSL